MDERNSSRRGKEGRTGDTPESPGLEGRQAAGEGEEAGRRSGETATQSIHGAPAESGRSALREPSRQKSKGREATESVKESGREAASEVREKAAEVTAEAKDRMSGAAEERKGQAAQALERVAHAVRAASESLREEDAEELSRYGEQAAERVERLSSYLRETDFRAMISNVEDFARRRPEIFYGGLVLGGVVAGRFLRSTNARGGGSPAHRPGLESRDRWAGIGGGARGQLPRSTRPPTEPVGDGITTGIGRHEPFGGRHE